MIKNLYLYMSEKAIMLGIQTLTVLLIKNIMRDQCDIGEKSWEIPGSTFFQII